MVDSHYQMNSVERLTLSGFRLTALIYSFATGFLISYVGPVTASKIATAPLL